MAGWRSLRRSTSRNASSACTSCNRALAQSTTLPRCQRLSAGRLSVFIGVHPWLIHFGCSAAALGPFVVFAELKLLTWMGWTEAARPQTVFRSSPGVERQRPYSPSLLGPSQASESATVPPPSPWPAVRRAPASRSDNPDHRDVTRALDAGPAPRFPFRTGKHTVRPRQGPGWLRPRAARLADCETSGRPEARGECPTRAFHPASDRAT